MMLLIGGALTLLLVGPAGVKAGLVMITGAILYIGGEVLAAMRLIVK